MTWKTAITAFFIVILWTLSGVKFLGGLTFIAEVTLPFDPQSKVFTSATSDSVLSSRCPVFFCLGLYCHTMRLTPMCSRGNRLPNTIVLLLRICLTPMCSRGITCLTPWCSRNMQKKICTDFTLPITMHTLWCLAWLLPSLSRLVSRLYD